ncbi:MAG: protein-L-isoaspartate(D-aspartate) O-methyltransferase [Candidatus Eisenbacteria bacterium]
MAKSNAQDAFSLARRNMVSSQLEGRGIRDRRVLEVMSRVPRHVFVEEGLWSKAYGDHALPIGFGQTISQPYVVARISELLRLKGDEKILEVGLGSGYHAAVLSRLGRAVFAVERIPRLLEKGRAALSLLGMSNVVVRLGDGRVGWKSFAPFDRIVVSAAASEVPTALLEQLEEAGVLVMPVGSSEEQRLVVVEKRGEKLLRREIEPVRFVPLVGQAS